MGEMGKIFNEVDRELGRRLYPGSFGQIGLLTVLLISTKLCSEHMATALFFGGMIVAANLGRLKLGFSFARFGDHADRWRLLYRLATLTTGAAWGGLNVAVLRHYEATSLTTLYSFVNLCGIAAAGTSALSPRPKDARWFLFLLLFPSVIELTLLSPPSEWPVAALVVAYFIFLSAQASVQGKSFAALQEAVAHYRAISENSGEGILIHQNSIVVDANSAMSKIFGHSLERMLGANVTLFCDEENLRRAYAGIGPSRNQTTIEAIHADGRRFPIEVCGIDCLWQGKPARAVRLRDLSESTRIARLLENAKDAAEAEVAARTAELTDLARTLRESENRLEAVVEQSPLATFLLRPDGTVSQVNRAVKNLWRISDAQVREKFLQGYSLGQDPNWEEQGMAGLLAEARRGKASFLPSVLYDPARAGFSGEPFWLEVFLAPVKKPDGTVTELTLLLRDITRRRLDEAERAALEIREQSALEASRLKSEFLANISHEIRTPMNGVLGMADILLSTPLNEEQREFSETIKRSGEGLLTLMNDILDFSKIEAGKLEFESVVFSLSARVRDVERGFSVLAASKDIKFKVEPAADLPAAVRGDPGRLIQVLNNLVGNAIKFTTVGSVALRVSVLPARRAGTRYIRVEVADTGPGIAPEVRARLFEPFIQADASTTRKFGGTGLGLSITKRLVEKMRGRIGVESELGRGSTFWAEFELENAAASELADAAIDQAAEAPLAFAKVLLAEDNLINQRIAARMLQRLGMQVTVANNGQEAVDALRRDRYQLVFMDVQMPEMDGLAAARFVRQDLQTMNPSVPIVALTANALKGDDQICFDHGMDDYLTKPITAARLRVMLVKWLKTADDASAA
ncbi:MAG: response regulator [Proteobacteria bacterium]|nr:MAG: response regulator [Pseudomonadota bacterium]